MVSTGDTAPTFTATYRGSDHETLDLESYLGDGPVVLAFFPGAFTPPCTNEMVALQEHLDRFEDAGATVFGVSADSAFSLGAFADRAVFVVDDEGTVTYDWVADDPTSEPDYDELVDAVEAA
jgi:peroxiredoxin